MVHDDEYLASGFADVDGRGDTEAYNRCLALIDSLPYYRECKGLSYELLALSAGLSVLEVSCGIGDDAFRMAERVAPGGRVVGIDVSARMIEEALHRTPEKLCAEFLRADARDLPFDDNRFERCRIDRTLQHIRCPEKAIGEMIRVLKPGGLLLAYDNDWNTFSVSGNDTETTGVIETLWAGSFTNKRIGRRLEQYFTAGGLSDVLLYPSVSVITDFELADQIYNLRQSSKRAVESGRLPAAAADRWLSDLQARSESGGFLCSLTAFTVVGRKP